VIDALTAFAEASGEPPDAGDPFGWDVSGPS
jgi:hypothetical protein